VELFPIGYLIVSPNRVFHLI